MRWWSLGIALSVIGLTLYGCGGGGGGGGGSVQSVPAPQQTTVIVLPASAAVTLGASGGSGTVTASGISTTLTFAAPTGGVGATLQLSASASAPGGISGPQSGTRRKPLSASGIVYVSVSTNAYVTIAQMPTISTAASIGGVAYYNPLLNYWIYSYTAGSNGYTAPGQFFLQPSQTYTFALYTGTPTVNATPTPVPGTASVLPAYLVGPGSHGWGPYASAAAFQYPVQSGYDGTGVAVAVVGDYPPSLTDIQTYLVGYGIYGHSGTFAVHNVDNGSPETDTNGLGEATLDVETIAGLAPGANIIFYATPDSSDQSFLDAYEAILEQHTASVVSISYGGCEAISPSYDAVADAVIAQGTQQGVTFIASSGDFGDRCSIGTSTTFGVNFPASDPNVIGVGGTEASTGGCGPGTIASQQIWNDYCFTSGQGASGGGISAEFSLPSYQSGVAGIASGSYRNVPDLAMPAFPVEIYEQGLWKTVGGTSWSAPQFAAMIAEIYEWCNAPLTPPVLIPYYAFQADGYSDFLAVTTGNNDFGGDSTYYLAGGGFSNAAGLGVPYGMPIAQRICPGRVPLSILHRVGAMSATIESGSRVAPQQLRTLNLRGTTDLGRRADTSLTKVIVGLQPSASMAQAEQAVVASLTAAGFTVTKTYANHAIIDAQASASVVASYFQTELHDVSQGRFGTRYANVTPVVLPSSIASYVTGVIIDNLNVAVRLYHDVAPMVGR